MSSEEKQAQGWSAAFPADYELAGAGDSITDGQLGAGGHRPSEAKIEAKDIVKLYGEGAAYGGRFALPRAMVVGGGASDMAMRGVIGAPNSAMKKLSWANTTANTVEFSENSSLLRHNINPLGPLSRLQAISQVGTLAPGSDNSVGKGVAVDIGGIRRARGAYMLLFEQIFTITRPATGSAVKLNVGTFMFANKLNSIDAKTGGYGWARAINQSTVNDVKSQVAHVRTILQFRPWAAGESATRPLTSDDIFYSHYSDVTCSDAVSGASSGVATPTNIVSPSSQTVSKGLIMGAIKLNDDDKTIWIDMAAQLNSEAASDTNYMTLHSSRVTTLSGHDGLPFDWQSRELIEQ